MGIRSSNFIAFKPDVQFTPEFEKWLNAAPYMRRRDVGTLVTYESNFCPMWARDRMGEHCVSDLNEEILVHQFLGSIPTTSFLMRRAGEQNDYRGKWIDHPFHNDPHVNQIETDYKAAVAVI